MKTLSTTLLLIIILFAPYQDVVYQGEFDNYSRWTTFEGSWKIVKSGDQHQVIFGDDFEAKEAPDLKIFLSKTDLDDIESKNALSKGDPIFVAKLTSYKGAANYSIPASINISKYKTIIVHCEEYTKLWGGSSLK